MEQLNENEAKPIEDNFFQRSVGKTVDLSENKTLKALSIWWKYIVGVIVFLGLVYAYFFGTTKNEVDNGFVKKVNEFGLGFKYYRGVIKDSNDNIITTASCTLSYSDPEGKLFSKKNDTTDMRGYYLFKIPINAKALTLEVMKTPSDTKGLLQTIDENITDVPQTIIYP